MSLKNIGWSVVVLSVLIAIIQVFVLTGRQDLFWPGVVCVGALILLWLVVLVFALAKHGMRAAPLLLSAVVVAAVPGAISVYLRGCEQAQVCL